MKIQPHFIFIDQIHQLIVTTWELCKPNEIVSGNSI